MATATVEVPTVHVKSIAAVHLKNILFATDFSEYSRQALPHVTGLARKFGSSVYLCHVVTHSQLMDGAPEAAPYLYEALRKKSAEELMDMAYLPELEGLNIKPVLASGTLEDELRKAINENQIDLIVVGAYGRTGLRRLVRGSAKPICRIASCPVLTVGPDAILRKDMQFQRILVPIDFSDESTKILPHIRDIAREYGASITFLHVIPQEAAANTDAHVLAEDARRTLKRVFAKEFADHKPEFLIEVGDPAWAILRAARESKADLIAMGIHHASVPGIDLGSGVVHQVMAGAHCPVFTCRH